MSSETTANPAATETSERLWTPLFIVLLIVLAASVAGQVVGATQGSAELSAFAAMAFVGALLRVAWQTNRPWWRGASDPEIGPSPDNIEARLATRNATLIALGYAWGAISLAAVYLGTPLRWQHGWQYALGMALIAAAIYLTARGFARHWSPERRGLLAWITLLHGWAATGGLLWLIATGKLLTGKSDWAANVVFVGGAVVIAGIGAVALRTTRILAARDRSN